MYNTNHIICRTATHCTSAQQSAKVHLPGGLYCTEEEESDKKFERFRGNDLRVIYCLRSSTEKCNLERKFSSDFIFQLYQQYTWVSHTSQTWHAVSKNQIRTRLASKCELTLWSWLPMRHTALREGHHRSHSAIQLARVDLGQMMRWGLGMCL